MDQRHVSLDRAHCVICQHPIVVGETVAAVLGDLSTGEQTHSSPSFGFPGRGRNSQDFIVYKCGTEECWYLCGNPPCETCAVEPPGDEAILFHLDCFHFAKHHFQDLTPSYIWHVGLWSFAGARPYFIPKAHGILPLVGDNVPPPRDIPWGGVLTLNSILKGLATLPYELRELIASYCPDAPLLRYGVAAKWPSEIFYGIDKGTAVTVHGLDLPRWTRGTMVPDPCDSVNVKKYMRISLDNNGIREVEFLDSWPEPCESYMPIQGRRYIVQASNQPPYVEFQSKGGCLRLTDSESCVMWDTPTPPHPELSRFIYHPPLRVRCMPLDKSVTGITMIFTGHIIHGTHIHQGRLPVVPAPSYLQDTQVWRYFPLGPEEEIKEISTSDNDQFGVTTSHGRTYKFGKTTYEGSRRIPNYISHSIDGPFSYLLCNDLEPGEPIVLLGASRRPNEIVEITDYPSLPTYIRYPFSSRNVYCSQARLEGLSRVECFLGRTAEYGLDYPCVGVLLEYADGRRTALGECRVGVADTVQVTAPTALYLKPTPAQELFYCELWFPSSVSEAENLHESGWERKQVSGTVTWWHGVDIVEIVYSP